jgi:hypothetical protein
LQGNALERRADLDRCLIVGHRRFSKQPNRKTEVA